MALFGKSEKPKEESAAAQVRPIVGTTALCRVCNDRTAFTRCWIRVGRMKKCPCCGLDFADPGALYTKTQPACPQCGEFLEQPDFTYGLCDVCGSKYELTPGTKPCLLPNRAQRAEMAKYGKSWSHE